MNFNILVNFVPLSNNWHVFLLKKVKLKIMILNRSVKYNIVSVVSVLDILIILSLFIQEEGEKVTVY